MTSSKESGPSSALVLCGGRGERMGPDYAGRQKVLLDIGGISLLEQVVRGAVKASDGGMGEREVALLTGHAAADVTNEVRSWPKWLSNKVSTIRHYEPEAQNLADIVAETSVPRTLISGNILLDYPRVLHDVDAMLRQEPTRPVVVGSQTLRTSTHYAIEVAGNEVVDLTRRASTPAEREVVDVFGLTDDVIDLSDRERIPCATALARSIPQLRPLYVEYGGDWAHFETPQDFINYEEGEYGIIDHR